jgi:hypothetical protein
MSMSLLAAAERLDGPAFRSGDDDSRAASSPPSFAEANQHFFAFAGMPLVTWPPADEPGRGA